MNLAGVRLLATVLTIKSPGEPAFAGAFYWEPSRFRC
jgi:hypothetical protein